MDHDDREPKYPAVLVTRRPGQQSGEIHLVIEELNGLDPLATPMLLRMAAQVKENQLTVR